MQVGSGQPESPDTQQDHRTSVISGTEIDVYGNCRVGVNFAVSLFFMQEISLAMFSCISTKAPCEAPACMPGMGTKEPQVSYALKSEKKTSGGDTHLPIVSYDIMCLHRACRQSKYPMERSR